MSFDAPYPPYDPTDRNGFSYETVVKRWPTIITGVIDELHQQCHTLSLEVQQTLGPKDTLTDKIEEAKSIIATISKLKYEMGRDEPLAPILEDGEPLAETYNQELENLAAAEKNTWFTAPWLYAECYLYRLLRSYFAVTLHWGDFDPFLTLKNRTLKHSYNSILQLASSMHELEAEKEVLQTDDNKLEIFFKEMIQMCLWGNATDLSLLTHLSLSDMEKLQAVGKEAQTAKQEFILKDDQDALWSHVKSMSNGRVDIVLDNSGYELFTDLILADFLVTYTSHVSSIVFHPKMIPWFVSDVTPPDFKETFNLLLDSSFFDATGDNQTESRHHLTEMVTRWKGYLDQGVFSLSVPPNSCFGEHTDGSADFWTTPYPYWNMEAIAPKLYKQLVSSDLVIFKGDLNYRKLTGDIRWPAWTPFPEALRGLSGSFPVLSLRTNKADVVVGVDRATAEELDAKKGNKWRVDGKHALISFVARKQKD